MSHALLIGTAKGGFVLRGVQGRRRWELEGPHALASKVHDLRLDPRDGRTLLMTVGGGHLGPTLMRSTNAGKRWQEVPHPPRFASRTRRSKKGTSAGQSLSHSFWLEPGHPGEKGTWWLGSSPPGLFFSTDGGRKWEGVAGFNTNPRWADWTFGGNSGTPDGSMLHSIQIDPRDAAHLYVSISQGGTFESTDRGKSWKPLNQGVAADFLPPPPPEYGHDPHCVQIHPTHPDRLYQQNHCGIYRLDRDRGEEWVRIGKKMPKKVGDIGFPIALHPKDPDTAWVFPMDGTKLWPRTSPGGMPAVYRTQDAGKSWQRLDRGLPAEQAWLTVKRQAMCTDDEKRVGVYFGTTSGEIWGSSDGGESWRCLVQHLPHIYAVRWARLA